MSSIGAQLRASREARGLSIDAVAHTTRVQPRILAAIERDDVTAVPPRPFGRGFVRAYAREMGLDGDQMMRDYFAQFAPPAVPAPVVAEATPAPRTLKLNGMPVGPLAVASAGALAAMLIAAAVIRPATRSDSPSTAARAVGTSGTVASAAPKSTDATPGAPAAAPTTGAPSAASAPPSPVGSPVSTAPITIVLTAVRPSWVTADADGRRALYRTVTPGSPETITATREIVIRVGNAGALAWQVNGRELGAMGREGQIRDVTITPKTAATIR